MDFGLLDVNSDGYVKKDKFSELLTNYHFGKDLSKAEYNYMFGKIDSEFSGEFNLMDFLKIMRKEGDLMSKAKPYFVI
ncbi:MAG: EF-hand domain-containing protein [Proteobacteria bacterium]|nr:MAG: EF-hand domain-containing protein [Pseudomonadota bacterium]